MVICGIDYSMSSPAICIGQKGDIFENLIFYCFATKKKHISNKSQIVLLEYPEYKNNEERFDKISNLFLDIILKHNVKLCKIEGYSFGSVSGMTFDLAENTGLLKHKLYKNNISVELYPPKTVKSQFTKRGDAGKGVMYMEFRDNHCPYEIHYAIGETSIPNDIGNPVSDLIDAYALFKVDKELVKKKIVKKKSVIRKPKEKLPEKIFQKDIDLDLDEL